MSEKNSKAGSKKNARKLLVETIYAKLETATGEYKPVIGEKKLKTHLDKFSRNLVKEILAAEKKAKDKQKKKKEDAAGDTQKKKVHRKNK